MKRFIPLFFVFTLALILVLPACSKPADDEKPTGSSNSESISESDLSQDEVEKEPDAASFLDCDYVLFDTGEELALYRAVLIFEDRAIIYGFSGNVSAYSLETGEKLFSVATDSYEKFERIYKTDEKDGYDYCVAFRSGIYCLNSKDPNSIYYEELPKELCDDTTDLNALVTYSSGKKYFVWVSPDGIDFMNKETGETKTILENSLIESQVVNRATPTNDVFNPTGGEKPYSYFEPVLICDGTKVAVQVQSSDYIYFAFVLYDIESENIELCVSYPENFSPVYPIDDRFISLRTSTKEYFFDGESASVSEYPVESRERIYANRKIATRYSSNSWDAYGLEVFYCPEGDFTNSHRLFSVTQDETSAYIYSISDTHIVLNLYKDGEEYLCVVKLPDYAV